MKSIYKNFTKKTLLSILIVHFYMLSFAATYYISPTGNDATGDGTINKPYFTLNKVWTVIGAGDTVYLRGGTYAFNTQQLLRGKNGTSGNLINIFAYPNETPILTKSVSYTQTDGKGIYFEGSYFYWRGIEITGFVQVNANTALAYGMQAIASSNNTFELLKVHGNGTGFNMANNQSTTIHCTGNLFLNCDFYENQDPLTPGNNYGNADGLSIAFIGITTDTNTIRGCRFWWNSDDGIDMYNNDGFVLVENCWSFYNGYIPNTFNDGGDGIGVKLGDSYLNLSTTHMRTVKDCIAVKNRKHGFGQNGLYGIVKIYNSIGYANNAQSYSMGIHLGDFNIAHVVENCIAYGNTLSPNLGTNATSITNSWQNGHVVNDADFISVNQSLLLTARQADGSLPVTDFLKLASNSDLINSGTVISGIPYKGTAPDIGVYETDNIDTTSPVVSTFSIPTTSTSFMVPISTYSAADNIGVTGYMLTETSATPSVEATGWSATKPTSYTFSEIGTKTLYAWAKDAAGNISASLSASVIISSPTASTFTVTGPSSGNVNSLSSNFTVIPNNLFTGTITLTPSGSGSAGLSAIVLTFSNSATAKTFTITPTVAGSVTLTPTNSGSLANPTNLTYAAIAVVPNAPTSLVATAGNGNASVAFMAPTNTGGSSITGYTVTSIPAGGIDINAGSTTLTHNITGLTNGISYTFTVKATNSIGTSVASAASNLVIPTAPVATTFTFTGPSSGNVNSASANFTVAPNNLFTGTITLIPSGAGSAGLSAKVLTFSNTLTAQNFTITPIVAGSITLTPTNSGILSNPASLTYNVNAVVPNAPTSVIATSGDASASVTFVAPISNGGSVITGYSVNSIPSGGVDTNAGSTSLTHIISGLTNGISYTFTVIAINSAGSSSASVASNSMIPNVADVITKQGEITPSHFTTVWQGLNGLNHMNINVVSALLEDLPLSVDDEIAVFSGSKCVGAAKLIQSIVPSDNSTFLTILASQDDGSGNGFIDSDTIVFKIWDNKTQSELQINAAVYRNDISTWKTNGKYFPGATAVVEIASYKVYTQSIELLKGYNMISTYVSAQNPNISSVTKTLVDQGDLIKMQDETGNSFENWGSFGGWINQLGSLEETEGYKIQVTNNCTFQVTGRSIVMPFDISLKTGWNIISYPRADMINAMNVFQTLIDQNKLVKVQDEAGNSIENWGLFGGWKNGIGNLIPGKAYKVKMSVDAILTFQESYPKSAVILTKAEQTEYYHSSIEGNGTDHMNINITGLSSIGISVGDELAAFDGTVCVATTKITEANILSGSASLTPSFSTDNQNPNGFKVGDQIQILAWNKLSGDELEVNAEVIAGQMKYDKNASVLVQMKSATIATAVTNLNDVVKIDVFPNPCQGRVTVRFSEIPQADSRIEISDISGRKLITILISGTTEEINLDSFSPGLYLVKSILGKNEYVRKLIVNK